MSERTIQRYLTVGSLIGLATSPFTGLIGLTAFGILLSGKFLRLTYNETARKEYKEEKDQLRAEKRAEKAARGETERKQELEFAELKYKYQLEFKKLNDEREARRETAYTNYLNGSFETGERIIKSYLERLNDEQFGLVSSWRITPSSRQDFLAGRTGLEVEVLKNQQRIRVAA